MSSVTTPARPVSRPGANASARRTPAPRRRPAPAAVSRGTTSFAGRLAGTVRAVTPAVAKRPRSRPSLVPFVLVLCAILVTGLLTLLLLNTVLVQRAFAESALRTEAARAAEREAELRRELARVSTPHALYAKARKLGLANPDNPAFLDPATGEVAGVASPVKPPPVAKKPASRTSPVNRSRRAPVTGTSTDARTTAGAGSAGGARR